MKTLKVLALALSYPSSDLIRAVPELRAVVAADGALPRSAAERLDALLEDFGRSDLYDLQERYVFLFDRTRSLSLHLFEHVHGESRDRGQAMVDLRGVYEAAGLDIAERELPDYLPMFLEFLSMQPADTVRQYLGETLHILTALADRLARRGSPYAAAFEALVALSNAKARPDDLALVVAEGDDPEDLDALDAVWAEEPVTFGSSTMGSCGKDALAARLRAARRPADKLNPLA